MLLILDLDETLIHAAETLCDGREPHFILGPYFVYKRPYVQPFLEFCREHYEVAVWTSSSADYAVHFVGELFGDGYPLRFLWSRDRCTPRICPRTYLYEWLKPLKKVKRLGYPLERILVVDDTPAKLARNFGNLIAVKPFLGDAADTELRDLMPYLLSLKNETNVRPIEKRHWRSVTRSF